MKNGQGNITLIGGKKQSDAFHYFVLAVITGIAIKEIKRISRKFGVCFYTFLVKKAK